MLSRKSSSSYNRSTTSSKHWKFRYDFIIFILLIILINCCYLNKAYPSPSFRKSCGTDLSKRIVLICKDYGGMCSIHSTFRVERMKRTKRRVVEECCHNPCDDDWLKIYCCNTD